ncbi:hypothetical protein B0J14DRAFT_605884 [Halenospora varia]|nr:hypothetical protein B0J14DRAFT_605884 [Halenospora varia]
MGMRIKDLGDAVLNATWIHSKLPPEMLTQVAKFPEKDGLRAIFDQLQEKSAIHSAKISRFKSFLESSIGGKKVTCDDKSITLGAIQKEVRFWQLSPDTDRKDLARALGKIEKLDYSLYTACLVVIIQEEDFLVRKLNLWLQPGGEERCLNFAKNLAQRRELNQFQDECWLLLLIALINEQGPRFLQNLSRCRSPAEWLELVDVVTRLLGLVRSRLPRAGAGVTQERLQWWGQLSTKTLASIQSFLKRLNEERDFEWMYFPTDQEQANNLLDLTKQWPRMTLLHRHIVSLLSSNGSNIALVCECIRALGQSSPLGQSVCERILARTGGVIKWPPDQLAIVTEGWLRSRILDSPDKATIRLLQGLLRHPSRAEAWSLDLRFTTEQLESSVETLLKKASELEALRTGFRRQHPLEMTALLSRMGVDDTSSGRAGNEDIPEELSDAIEIVDGDTYEICFVLTELSVLQRLARGISEDSRLLLIRVRIRGSPRFCIHFFSNSEGEQEHDYWRPTRWSDPNNDICTTRSTIFTYYLARNLHRTLRKVNPTLREIHSMVRKLIHTPPATCLVCPSNTSASLWKASACSKDCTIQLRKSPLSVRLHNMLVDPSAMDLILTSIYAAAVEGRDLLPGCPIERATLCSVIDSFPSLETIQTSGNLQQAIRGTDTLGKDREKLLSWLCLTFRGFIVKAPGDFRIPSMPNTHQYLMLNSNHDQELNFKTHLMANEGATTGVVFHGTPTSHLFKILVEGLKVMYGADVLHGAALGSGVYCGDDQATSFPYAGATGSSWRHSKMGNMKIMLGCELAGYVAPAGYNAHVVDNGEKLLIRYIFLLPQNYQPPPRHHVEPAMKTAYAKIRSGMVI